MNLKKYVQDFRNGLLNKQTSRDKCFIVTAPLESLLILNGYKVRSVDGEVNGHHHFWLELEDGTIIDPTADQFRTPKGRRMPKVYIGEKPEWYIRKPLSSK